MTPTPVEGASRSGSETTQPQPVQSKIVIPDTAVLSLLGSRDENLKHHRGAARRRRPRPRQRGHPHRHPGGRRVRRAGLRRAGHPGPPRPAAVPTRSGRPRRCSTQGRRRIARRGAQPEHPVPPRPHDPAQDAEPEALRRRDRQAHDRLRHRPGRHRQDLPGDGQGGAGAAGQAGQPDHPDPARRSRPASGWASCPAR